MTERIAEDTNRANTPRAYEMFEEAYGAVFCCSDQTICDFHRAHPNEVRPSE